MVRVQARRFNTNWPTYFTVAVVAYFILSAIGVRSHIPFMNSSSEDNDTQSSAAIASSSTTSTSTARVSTSWKAKVVGFRISPDKKDLGSFDATVTLEIRNESKQNIDFYPNQLRLGVTGAGSSQAASTDASVVTVSPQLPVIVPVNFSVQPRAGATYDLTYQGRTIFSGKPA
jgi:hypothetical protein